MEPVEKCENCGQDFPQSKINSHFSYCRRNIRRCDQCKEMVDINYLDEHNQDFHTKQACKHCRKQVSPQELVKHEGSCPSRPKFCEYCELDIAMTEFERHVGTCGSRTKLCTRCQKNVMLREFDVHSVSCRGKVVSPSPPPPVRPAETVQREVQKKPVVANREPQQYSNPANQYRPDTYMYKPENAPVQPVPTKKVDPVVRHNIPPNSNKVVNGGGQDYFRQEPSNPVKQGDSRNKDVRRQTKPEQKKYTYQQPEKNERPHNIPSTIPAYIPSVPATGNRLNEKPKQPAPTTTTTTTTTTTNNYRREPIFSNYEEQKQTVPEPPRRNRPVVQPPVYQSTRNTSPPPMPIDEDEQLQKAIEQSLRQNKKNPGLGDLQMDQMSQSFYRDVQLQDHIESSFKQKAQQPTRRR